MKFRHVLVCVLAAVLPAIAVAQEARAITAVALRAGPDREYPFVASYVAGTPLMVQGCTEGYGWCDVIGPNGYRGWVYAGNLGYPYQRRQVPILGYGPAIGIPIVTFALGSYWGAHYYNRAWYRDRARWEHYRPVLLPPAGRRPARARAATARRRRPPPAGSSPPGGRRQATASSPSGAGACPVTAPLPRSAGTCSRSGRSSRAAPT